VAFAYAMLLLIWVMFVAWLSSFVLFFLLVVLCVFVRLLGKFGLELQDELVYSTYNKIREIAQMKCHYM
jgi:hypothetical protein